MEKANEKFAASFANLTACYGEEAKIIFLVRHGIKNGEHIDPNCLEDIMAHGFTGLIPGINVVHHGTEFVRTDETASAATIWILQHEGQIEKHLCKSSVLGGEELMSLITPEVMRKIKTGVPNYRALVGTEPTGLFQWQRKVWREINSIFLDMSPSDRCLMPGHTPVIETVFNLFCPKGDEDIDMVVKELTGIFLVQVNDQKVIAWR